MTKVILLAYFVFTVPSINAEEETLCEKQWNEYYENLPESERTSNDSLVRAVMIDDCNNDYKLAIERQKEMMVTSMHAYAEGNYIIAYNEFKMLAEVGYADAQFNLATMYYNGEAVTQDYKEAMKWYRLAAEQGTEEAVRSQHNLGWMYDEGLGVIQDNIIAYMWYNIAVVNGHQDSENARESVKNNLTDEQFNKADELSRLCVKNNYTNCGYVKL